MKRIKWMILGVSLALAAGSAYAGSGAVLRKSVPTPPSTELGLSAKPAAPVKYHQHCSNAAACNDLIAYCIGNGGQWVPGRYNRKGQATLGDCFID